MMIKKYEEMKKKFRVGDYVVASEIKGFKTNLMSFFQNNVGQIYFIEPEEGRKYYDIHYKVLPDELRDELKPIGIKPYDFQEGDGIFHFLENELRFATENEIDEYLIDLEAKKYKI